MAKMDYSTSFNNIAKIYDEARVGYPLEFLIGEIMTKLRVHHFFDILRDYGAGKELQPHLYGHSYHLIGREIFDNNLSEFEIVVACDDICVNCSKIDNEICTDVIDHRIDFKMKEQFNDFIDKRIMNEMNLEQGQIVKVSEIINNAGLYLDNIFDIYSGNSIEHTEMRRLNVELGIEKKKSEFSNA